MERTNLIDMLLPQETNPALSTSGSHLTVVEAGPSAATPTEEVLGRGLVNETGENNCFLNVIIQSLWHLPTFRSTLLLEPEPRAWEPAPPKEDVEMLQALRRVFAALSEQQSTIAPRELRAALRLSVGAEWFDLEQKHDAMEVLDLIFAALHRALGGGGQGRIVGSLFSWLQACIGNGSGMAMNGMQHWLHNLSVAFALAIVWDTAQASSQEIASTMSGLSTELKLSAMHMCGCGGRRHPEVLRAREHGRSWHANMPHAAADGHPEVSEGARAWSPWDASTCCYAAGGAGHLEVLRGRASMAGCPWDANTIM
ncbi:hypothetical protein CYMTET_47844 [Cymbomonas tetramitiformis]|uniref:USP domain-containing protein n=1 Tax=Cymbomonas tetramitiformis TaxID=36881 RepID=A0AAE0BUI3_9CHLO|nr:hypothetical protein CYMTET_47844 [Cymbomonas tetramitiformis]